MEKIYKEHYLILYMAAYKILEDKYLAEDAIDEVFLNVLKGSLDLNCMDSESIKKYLISSVKNEAYRILKKRAKLTCYSLDVYQDSLCCAVAENEFAYEDNIRLYDEYISRIDGVTRNAVYMYLIENRTMAEIAQKCNISIETAKKRVQRGKNKLREIMNSDSND